MLVTKQIIGKVTIEVEKSMHLICSYMPSSILSSMSQVVNLSSVRKSSFELVLLKTNELFLFSKTGFEHMFDGVV